MIRFVIILCLLSISFATSVSCEEEIEIDSQVMSVNPDKEYVIIKAGENDGIEIGDGLIIHRDADKIAEAQVIEVRPNVSAAEILNVEKEKKKEIVQKVVEKDKEIKEGDSILIVKKAKGPSSEEMEAYKKSKWTTILGYKPEIKGAVPVETIIPGGATGIESISPERIQVAQEGSIVRADIDTDLNTVFSYALLALRENGYSVVLSNRATGLILATKPIELSLMSELWADAVAAIEHRIVVSIEIKGKGDISELNISSFKEHTQKNKQVKFPITQDSKYYNDLIELAKKIKARTGR